MKAVVWHGVGDFRLDDVEEPRLQAPTDAIVRLTASDGLLSAYGETACILKPENQAPVVNAGPDMTATIEAELLQNTGAEAALVNGKLPSWTEVAGTWTATSTAIEPFRGTQTFVSSGPSATELMQDVDVTSYGGTIARPPSSSAFAAASSTSWTQKSTLQCGGASFGGSRMATTSRGTGCWGSPPTKPGSRHMVMSPKASGSQPNTAA